MVKFGKEYRKLQLDEWKKYYMDYKGLKRKRRFLCDQCEKGYLLIDNSTCYNCHTLGLSNCEKCNLDEIKDNELVCLQCKEGYFLTEYGACTKCNNNKVRVKGNKCVHDSAPRFAIL